MGYPNICFGFNRKSVHKLNNQKEDVFTVINLALTILSLCIAGYIWIDKINQQEVSVLYAIVYLCLVLLQFIVEKHSQSWMKLISLSTLIMFSGILLVVLIAVSEEMFLMDWISCLMEPALEREKNN
jgi:uncharacterized membrane protein